MKRAIRAAGDDLPGDVADLIDRAFAQVTATGTVQVRVAIELVIELNDALVRDAVLARAVVELDQPWLPLLIACATWTPDFLAADCVRCCPWSPTGTAMARSHSSRSTAAWPSNRNTRWPS